MSGWGLGAFGYADDAGSDDEEQEGFEQRFATKDSVIFMIDTCQPMFDRPAGGAGDGEDEEESQSHFELCVKCVRSVMTNKIISSEKDLLGVVFFGTEQDKNSGGFKHVYVLQDLDQPTASRILEVESFLKDDNNSFDTNFGHSTGFSLSDALWTCSNMFSQSSQKIGHKRILLFTNADDPHAGNIAFQRQAKQKAKDLSEIGIDIELMHMTRPGKQFDLTKFYQDIIHTADDEELDVLPDPAEKFEELLNRVRAKDHKKRTMGKIQFSLGKDLSLGVAIYSLVRTQTKPYPVKLYKKTNEPLKSKTKMFCEDTGELLMPSDIKKFQSYGGSDIIFEQEEVKEVKKFGDPGLLLMGFKPRSFLKRYYHVRPCQFLFPEETVVQGSTTLFSALLQRCLAKDVVAICRYIPRKNTPPKFVALMPQEEELDEHNVQITPPGFHVVFLPFSDDMRKLKFAEDQPKATTEQIDGAKDVIKKLQFKFSSENFENPVLQTHYRNLEALALDRDAPDEVVDYTAPDHDMINGRAGAKIEAFKELVFPDGYVPGAKPPAKRKAAGADGAAKKAKTENVDMQQYAQEGKLNKLTVAVLKEFCQQTGLSAAGKKGDLVETVKTHFGL
ncbi:X-ray repair cross-complementing protein 5-like [Amphiura filiformis]|uniref:X-ray repair cross-complementing protein 5-like n=1 Tax=Amphiura filiformis TaxID=82378 RepID=UPI003B21AC6C